MNVEEIRQLEFLVASPGWRLFKAYLHGEATSRESASEMLPVNLETFLERERLIGAKQFAKNLPGSFERYVETLKAERNA